MKDARIELQKQEILYTEHEWQDKLLEFTTLILHGGEEHQLWLAQAAINFCEGYTLNHNNEFKK